MGRTYNIVTLPGDGIGPEVVAAAVQVLKEVAKHRPEHSFNIKEHAFGGCAIDATGIPLPDETLTACREADAIILGAVGGPKWGVGKVRPEQGLLLLRKSLNLYANIRPALFPSESLLPLSPLKASIAQGTNIIVVRELIGGIYFGERTEAADGAEAFTEDKAQDKNATAVDQSSYNVAEIRRITRLAAALALVAKNDPKGDGKPLKIWSVDKANVLATSRLWRKTVTHTLKEEFPEIEFDHQLVDSAAMIICSKPRALNGIVLTENLFGDILSDETSVIPGSLGLLPSASLSGLPDASATPDSPSRCLGLYEPIHGSAPDIAGRGIANPVGTILSVAMMLRYSLNLEIEAKAVEDAVRKVLDDEDKGGLGLRTADLEGGKASTMQVGEAVAKQVGEILGGGKS